MLCGKRVLAHADPEDAMGQGLQIRPTTIGTPDDDNLNSELLILTCAPELELEEDHTCVSLTIVDTPGFGDDIDNEAR